jgi:hypothetical protein
MGAESLSATGVLPEQFESGLHLFKSAKVATYLCEQQLLGLVCLLEVLHRIRSIRSQRPVRHGIGQAVTRPPRDHIQSSGISKTHMTLDLMNGSETRMDFMPKPGEGIAIMGPSKSRMMETVHQGLTIDDKFHLCAWAGMQVCEHKPEVFGKHRRTRMPRRYAHADREDAPV